MSRDTCSSHSANAILQTKCNTGIFFCVSLPIYVTFVYMSASKREIMKFVMGKINYNVICTPRNKLFSFHGVELLLARYDLISTAHQSVDGSSCITYTN